MMSIQQQPQWSRAILLLCLAFPTSLAFSPVTMKPASQRLLTTSRQRMVVDPHHVVSAVSGPELPALLSTLLSSAISPVAHGHSNPLFGNPDPILAAGKSIAPSAKAMVDLGITQVKTAADILPAGEGPTTPDFAQSVQVAMTRGWKVLSEANIMNGGGTHLPGFEETRGILPHHNPNLPVETPETFAASVQWGANFLQVIDKLPYAAFWYALVEFFILRPGIDLYKEDIENDPNGAMMETLTVAGVRMGAFFIIALVTSTMFG
jgi:hypothetical protein